MRTQRAEEREAGEGDDPEIHRVDNVTTIELEGLVSETWVNKRSIEQRTDQKAIG